MTKCLLFSALILVTQAFPGSSQSFDQVAFGSNPKLKNISISIFDGFIPNSSFEKSKWLASNVEKMGLKISLLSLSILHFNQEVEFALNQL